MKLVGATLCAALLAGCHSNDATKAHGHAHGESGHGHGESHGHGAEDGPEPVAVTRWTATHELFVEFDPPTVGGAVQYHAHVTRLADNHAATEGTLDVEWLVKDDVAASFVALKVARKGIFAFSAAAPEKAGRYALRFTYRHDDEEAVWDAGSYEIGKAPGTPPDTPEGEISFLKEAQWKIPFTTEPATKRTLARSVRLMARVDPHPGAVRVLAASAEGQLAWPADGALAVGSRVEVDQVVATVQPAVTHDDWSTVRLRVREAEVERRRAGAEVARLRGLVADGLVPGRRLDQARAALASARARLETAQQQRDQMRGARPEEIPIRATEAGIVTELLVREGQTVEAGQPIVRVALAGPRRLTAEVLPAELPAVDALRAASITADDGPPVSIPLDRLDTQALIVDPATGLAPLAFTVSAPTVAIGQRVPLVLSVGAEAEVLAVPRSAIVEINTRPFVFVMMGGESFTRRAVEIGLSSATHVGVTRGLSPGDRVVTVGGFDVYVAALSGSLESHRH